MWDIRLENVHKNRHKVTKEAEGETNFGRKTSTLSRRQRDAYFCDWSLGDEPRFQCFFESRHDSMLERIRRRREQRCSLLNKAKKLRLQRNQVCGQFEALLNSCPWKGDVDIGCAQMLMGSATFRQYLGILNSKERASIEKVRERRMRLECHSGQQSFQ